MKKTLLAGAIAALALFGCSTDEVNYDRYSLVEDVAAGPQILKSSLQCL